MKKWKAGKRCLGIGAGVLPSLGPRFGSFNDVDMRVFEHWERESAGIAL